jgi:threonine/homoserine/homoserine lactone efflux protein
MGIHDLALFVAAGLLLNVTPGPDMAYIAARSAAGGFRAGAAATLGITAGCIAHTVAAALGLSALLATSAAAFEIVKWCGAAYLLYLGVKLVGGSVRAKPALGARPLLPPASAAKILREGFVINVFNPKVALFFLAFLPQFVDANAAHPAVQIAFLGVLFALLGLVTDSIWALAAGTAGGMLRRSHRFLRTQRYVAGTVYVGLGVATAFAGGSDDS